jgi:RNA polymerase sigma factor (TIGR02999 family)
MHTQWNALKLSDGSQQEFFEDLYRELKIIARGKMIGERSFINLSATALVHEAWMRLEKSAPEMWRDRSQFFAAASEAMRRILVEAARKRNAIKRGSGQVDVPLEGIELPDGIDHQQLLEVNDALDELEGKDPFKAQIVKMRFYCGMENEEIAAILEVNEKTVRRHWQLAKVILYRVIQDDR